MANISLKDFLNVVNVGSFIEIVADDKLATSTIIKSLQYTIYIRDGISDREIIKEICADHYGPENFGEGDGVLKFGLHIVDINRLPRIETIQAKDANTFKLTIKWE